MIKFTYSDTCCPHCHEILGGHVSFTPKTDGIVHFLHTKCGQRFDPYQLPAFSIPQPPTGGITIDPVEKILFSDNALTSTSILMSLGRLSANVLSWGMHSPPNQPIVGIFALSHALHIFIAVLSRPTPKPDDLILWLSAQRPTQRSIEQLANRISKFFPGGLQEAGGRICATPGVAALLERVQSEPDATILPAVPVIDYETQNINFLAQNPELTGLCWSAYQKHGRGALIVNPKANAGRQHFYLPQNLIKRFVVPAEEEETFEQIQIFMKNYNPQTDIVAVFLRDDPDDFGHTLGIHQLTTLPSPPKAYNLTAKKVTTLELWDRYDIKYRQN